MKFAIDYDNDDKVDVSYESYKNYLDELNDPDLVCDFDYLKVSNYYRFIN